MSGELAVDRSLEQGSPLYALDFPARPPAPCDAPIGLAEALGAAPQEILAARDFLCVFGSEDEVLALAENWRPFRSLATSYLFASAFDRTDGEA